MGENIVEIASYDTIGHGAMYPNACYNSREELKGSEKQQDKRFEKAGNHTYKRALLLLLVLLVVVATAGLCTGLVLKFSSLDKTIASLQTEMNYAKNNLSIIMQVVANTGLYQSLPAASCASILEKASSPESGYYWVRISNGSAAQMYCDMERTCGEITGGWTRVAKLNMTDPSMQCPTELLEHTFLIDKRTCTIPTYTDSCVSVFYNIEGIEYSHVCGRIFGYQYGSTDSFYKETNENPLTIDSNYVDGISLTRGNPREHIWTLAAGHCMDSCYHHRPPFISNKYFCDGVQYPNCTDFCDVTLWNGEQCDPQTKWFYNQMLQRKTDEIEMRICQDEGSSSEQTPIAEVELYIQ